MFSDVCFVYRYRLRDIAVPGPLARANGPRLLLPVRRHGAGVRAAPRRVQHRQTVLPVHRARAGRGAVRMARVAATAEGQAAARRQPLVTADWRLGGPAAAAAAAAGAAASRTDAEAAGRRPVHLAAVAGRPCRGSAGCGRVVHVTPAAAAAATAQWTLQRETSADTSLLFFSFFRRVTQCDNRGGN